MDARHLKPCQLCEFTSPNLTYLLKHTRHVHSHQPGFQVTCGLSGCQRTFRNFSVYRNHVYEFHGELEPIITHLASPILDEPEHMDDSEDILVNQCLSGHQRKRRAATWILKVQEQHKLPQSTMEEILRDVTGLFQDTLSDLQQQVCTRISAAGIDLNQVPGLAELFQDQSEFATPFMGLETQYLQLKFYKENFNFVVS